MYTESWIFSLTASIACDCSLVVSSVILEFFIVPVTDSCILVVNSEILFAVSLEFSAKFCISFATTENPLTNSPARAASIDD